MPADVSTPPAWPQGPAAPLPRTVTPFRGETVQSYLDRLAHANHLEPRGLRRYLADGPAICRPRPDWLATASGQPVGILHARLIGLAAPDRDTTRQRRHARPACRCAWHAAVSMSRSTAGCPTTRPSAAAPPMDRCRHLHPRRSTRSALRPRGDRRSAAPCPTGSVSRRRCALRGQGCRADSPLLGTQHQPVYAAACPRRRRHAHRRLPGPDRLGRHPGRRSSPDLGHRASHTRPCPRRRCGLRQRQRPVSPAPRPNPPHRTVDPRSTTQRHPPRTPLRRVETTTRSIPAITVPGWASWAASGLTAACGAMAQFSPC